MIELTCGSKQAGHYF